MEVFSCLEYFIRSIFHEEKRSQSRYFKQRTFDIGDRVQNYWEKKKGCVRLPKISNHRKLLVPLGLKVKRYYPKPVITGLSPFMVVSAIFAKVTAIVTTT